MIDFISGLIVGTAGTGIAIFLSKVNLYEEVMKDSEVERWNLLF